MKTIGIIGGMGPTATADLFQKIIANTAAATDSEHIPIIVDNNTKIPDRTAFLLAQQNGNAKTAENPLPYLQQSAKRLQVAGADFLLLSCNTAHYFYNEIVQSVDIPVLNMVKATANATMEICEKSQTKKAAILGTEGFMKCVNFRQYYQNVDIITPNFEQQQIVNQVIYTGIKANQPIKTADFLAVLQSLAQQGVEIFVLSCTELPLAFEKYGIGFPYVDSTLELAKVAILRAGGRLQK
ncbi:MAG: amino acid racemase [Firmicutes bacterium]|nr:amino acid racemase [Bacillota bacterium]